MKVLKGALIAAGVGAMMAVLSAAPASADVTQVNFTWNPGAVDGAGGTSQQFRSSGFQIADYARIALGTGNGSGGFDNVQESAILVINSISTVPAFSATPGFINGSGGGSGSAGNDYQLYFKVTAQSSIAPSGSDLKGTFTSLSYQFILDKGGKATFTQNLTANPLANANGDSQIVLASGNLAPGGANRVSIESGIPLAAVDADIHVDPGATGFFVDPTIFTGIFFDSLFGNTAVSVTQTTDGVGPVFVLGYNTDPNPDLDKQAGGGTVDLVAIPEPLTLSVFGAGLAGAAFARRRKAKKA